MTSPNIAESYTEGWRLAKRSVGAFVAYVMANLSLVGLGYFVFRLSHPPEGMHALFTKTVGNDPAAAQEKRLAAIIFITWLRSAWPIFLIFIALALLWIIWVRAGYLGCLSRADRDEGYTAATFVGDAMKNFGRFLGIYAIQMAILFGFFILLIILIAFTRLLAHHSPFLLRLTTFGDFILIAIGVLWISIRLLFGSYSIAYDQQTVTGGLQRSFEVTSGHWWEIVFLLFLPSLLLNFLLFLLNHLVGHSVLRFGVFGLRVLGTAFATWIVFTSLMSFYAGTLRKSQP